MKAVLMMIATTAMEVQLITLMTMMSMIRLWTVVMVSSEHCCYTSYFL